MDKKYRGVALHKLTNRYRAAITVNGKYHSAGYFVDPIDAARAYDTLAWKYLGPSAILNFPNDYKDQLESTPWVDIHEAARRLGLSGGSHLSTFLNDPEHPFFNIPRRKMGRHTQVVWEYFEEEYVSSRKYTDWQSFFGFTLRELGKILGISHEMARLRAARYLPILEDVEQYDIVLVSGDYGGYTASIYMGFQQMNAWGSLPSVAKLRLALLIAKAYPDGYDNGDTIHLSVAGSRALCGTETTNMLSAIATDCPKCIALREEIGRFTDLVDGAHRDKV